ncbi:MAG: hypothetical protein ING66_13005 [Rhodocyclaceae bacterium]|nr:hypothetical protein [Rhodocyclaceae bacterium]MCA3026550.1 hypothetical protein [Rhodocyclaceae bacterium]MCA3029497.1 hypothetical protein [Rhodocyclaceae bacterium]MCA3033569.1 hypothetical protein [Rhodocyclaceae bacterium]MCA3037980.1 hypothetical protein [Rhodocyclaceae bacterium]
MLFDGWKTDGGRNVTRTIEDAEWNAVPRFVKWFLKGGMAMEYETHLYSPGESGCEMMGNLICSSVRSFVRQVSKPHDLGNSWSYDRDALSTTFGNRIEGGGLNSLFSRVSYEVGMQTWSFATMLPMAAFTGVSLYGDYVNPSVFGRRRK